MLLILELVKCFHGGNLTQKRARDHRRRMYARTVAASARNTGSPRGRGRDTQGCPLDELLAVCCRYPIPQSACQRQFYNIIQNATFKSSGIQIRCSTEKE